MKVKIITDSEELEKFTSREDVTISKIDVRSCEQSFFAQQWFVAVVMYEENTCDNFDWQSFRNQAAKDILCATLSGGTASGAIGILEQKELIVEGSIEIADELIKQLKEKEGK